ncbi:MAG: hypothetical protein ACE5J9_11360 [Methanosarcinales archaeon]
MPKMQKNGIYSRTALIWRLAKYQNLQDSKLCTNLGCARNSNTLIIPSSWQIWRLAKYQNLQDSKRHK